jgi:hypothetical protein
MHLRATRVRADSEKQVSGALVRRGKGIVFQFLRLYPAKLRYAKRVGFLTGRNTDPIKNHVDYVTIVAVSAAASGGFHVHIDI